MDALVLERVGAEWAPLLEATVFRGVVREVGGVRAFFGPPPGARGVTWSLVVRWVEPIWIWLEEAPLPKSRDRAEATLRFEGSAVTSFAIPKLDRRVRVTFSDGSFLDIEVWPPGNAILVDRTNAVRWLARRRTASSVRGAMNLGLPYSPPPAPFRVDPRSATASDLQEVELGDIDAVADKLLHAFAGLPAPLARVAARVCAAANSEPDDAARKLAEWTSALYASDTPVLGLQWEDKHRVAHLVSLRANVPLGAEVRVLGPWPTWDAAARSLAREFPEAISNEELTEVRARVRRLEKSLRGARGDLAAARQAPEYRKKGEALLAFLPEVPRRATTVTLPDPENPERKLRIELDPKLPPHKNAAKFFQLAGKGERALDTIPMRIGVLESELQKTIKLLESLERGARPPGYTPPSLRGEVSPSRPSRGSFGPATHGRDAAPLRLLPRRYKTSEGWEVWIGKNNEGNDYLTHRLAHGEDYWFHARGAPGSHVVLRRGSGKNEPSKATLTEVASWAAFYSRMKTSNLVPVAYTLKKYVRKPRGSKPGLASIERETVLFARPQEPPKQALLESETAPVE